MSHEMLRYEAEEAGFDTDGLTIAIAGADREHDIVNVWPLLPDAELIKPEPLPGTIEADPPPDTSDLFDLGHPIDLEDASDR